MLYRVDASTRRPASDRDRPRWRLGGSSVAWADGLALIGRTLYVVQGPFDRISVVRLSADYTSGVVEGALTSPALEFPSSIAALGSSFYAVNARFDVPAGPGVEYQVVRVPR